MAIEHEEDETNFYEEDKTNPPVDSLMNDKKIHMMEHMKSSAVMGQAWYLFSTMVVADMKPDKAMGITKEAMEVWGEYERENYVENPNMNKIAEANINMPVISNEDSLLGFVEKFGDMLAKAMSRKETKVIDAMIEAGKEREESEGDMESGDSGNEPKEGHEEA
jgi:hypothetical protein